MISVSQLRGCTASHLTSHCCYIHDSPIYNEGGGHSVISVANIALITPLIPVSPAQVGQLGIVQVLPVGQERVRACSGRLAHVAQERGWLMIESIVLRGEGA